MRVFITGLGVISAIGNDVESNLEGLKKGSPVVSASKHLKTIHTELPVAEIAKTNEQLSELCGVSYSPINTRTSLLGLIAAQEACGQSDLKTALRTGLLSGNSVGGMDKTECKYSSTESSDSEFYNYIDTHDCGDSTRFIAHQLGIRHYSTTISTACSSSANTIMQGARLIKQGYLDRAVAGGCDALTKFTINGFNSLMILSKEHCKPFDHDRTGLNLGEGAGFVMLESERSIEKTGNGPICELAGYANVNEAYHATASSPEGLGAFEAMKRTLVLGGIQPSDVSYINAHGTGTENNDQAESMAIKKLFDGLKPLFSSTKAFTGHTLGAAGGIEAVYSALSLQQGVIFPNLNFEIPIESVGLEPQTILKTNQELKHVLSNSFGFGGNNTSLLFSKCS